jgi:oligopeptide transport system permease protein
MLRYSAKRLLQSLITLVVVASLAFLMLRLMPIRGYFQDGAWEKTSWEVKVSVLQKLGIYGEDREPLNPFVQLFNYYRTLLSTGSFGVSTQLYTGQEVGDLLASRIPVSMGIGLSSLVISLILGFLLGIGMARYKNSLLDNIGMGYIVLVTALPVVVIYFFVQFYLTGLIGSSMIYRSGQYITYIAPTVAIALVPIASYALWIRRYMVDDLNKDYVKLAYAKGLSSRAVLFRHVLRNAFIPMAYSLPIAILGTLSGAIIMERLFSVPGMGRLYIDAIGKRDNNFVQAIVIIYAAMGILGVFLGDVLAVIVDPRIKLTKKGDTR